MAQATTDPTIDRIEIVDQPEEATLQNQRSSGQIILLALLIGLFAAFVLGRRKAH